MLRRLFRRRERDAMALWTEQAHAGAARAPAHGGRAPDLAPEDVVVGERISMDGVRRVKPHTGSMTGLEGGGAGHPPSHYAG